MGTWGAGIESDDLVRDIMADFADGLKRGQSIAESAKALLAKHKESLADRDEGPLVWIALARSQWLYGSVDRQVLGRVETIVREGKGLDRWRESSATQLARRQKALLDFLEQIKTPNLKPRKPPKLIVRSPKYRPGDCLSVKLPNGKYGAAIVLAHDRSKPEYGMTLVGTLDYMEQKPPGSDVFERRKWLQLPYPGNQKRLAVAWYLHVGFRATKNKLEVVSTTKVRRRDPRVSRMYSGWALLSKELAQAKEGAT